MSVLFAAAEIAAAVGCTARTIHARMARVAGSEKCSRGQRTKAWTIAQLPERLRAELQRIAAQRGFRDARDLLVAPPVKWQPARPFAQIAERHTVKAAKLRDALTGTLQRLNDLDVSDADFRARGLADYRTVFGYAISEKQWRRVLDRTVARDAGAEDWTRIEIYLDDNINAPEQATTTVVAHARNEHRELYDLISSFKKSAAPNDVEEVLLWQLTFDRYQDIIAAGGKPKLVRRSLLDFLHAHVPTLAKTRHALHEAFNYKLARWQEHGGTPSALHDGRMAAARERKAQLSEVDRKTLLAFGAKLGGGLSQGWREAQRRGVLSPELSARYLANLASKSHVPAAIRAALGNDLKQLQHSMRGERCAEINGAFIERNPESFNSADVFQGDDTTLPNLYWEESAGGPPRLMRGQFLAFIDCRSQYVLGFVLISAPPDRPSTYNASHIRNLITTVHDSYGLPRKAFYFENGTWRAKALTGGALDGVHTEAGLREFGVRFVHARLSRAKIIERVNKALQNLTQAEPGYVGRGWHNDRYERVEKQQQRVESSRAAPSEHFYSRAEWIARLSAIVDQFNDEPQNGKYCAGLSPREAYEAHFGSEQLLRLPASARYLLANERRH